MSNQTATSRRTFPIALFLLAACLITAGCIKNKIVVKVRPDGSGQIMQSMIYTKESVMMMEEQMKQMQQMMATQGGGGSVTNNPYHNPRILRSLGRGYGTGVSLSTSREYNKGGARGYLALYDFKDISKLKIDARMSMAAIAMGQMPMSNDDMDEDELDEQMDQMLESMGQEGGDPITFQLSKGEQNELLVVVPEMESPISISEDDLEGEQVMPAGGMNMSEQMMAGGNPYGFTGQETETEMMQKMLGGMQLSMDVVVLDKEATAKDAIPRSGKANRWIVYDVDFGKLLAEQAVAQAIQASQQTMLSSGMDMAALGAFSELTGAKVQTNNFTITY